MAIYVPDVGDGLAVGIHTINNNRIQIDCGSQSDPEVALSKGLYRINPSAFFLSHFHLDHYNGLLKSKHRWPRPDIQQVFYPRMPVFKQRETFLRCLLAMNHWLIGDTSGSLAADFLSVLSKINRTPFTYRSLCMGDIVYLDASQYEILWPPRTIEDNATLKVIATAIRDFEVAAEEDESLRRILEVIGESGEIQPYIADEVESGKIPGYGENAEERFDLPYPEERGTLSEAISKANKSLRVAANHLSLAFHEDNKVLFMGDLEEHEISHVVRILAEKHRNSFFVMITPHHGTHWHNDISELHTYYAISSVGSRLFRDLSPEYKSMSDLCLITYLNGDIELPIFSPIWFGPRTWRYRHTFF